MSGWKALEVAWSEEAYMKGHGQVWLHSHGFWCGSWGGFLLVDYWGTSEEAKAAIDAVVTAAPLPGSSWGPV